MNRIPRMLGYVCLAAAAVGFTFFVHELTHWAMGTALGNEMQMSLNSAYPIARSYKESWHSTAVTLAGPAITLLQALVAFILVCLLFILVRRTSRRHGLSAGFNTASTALVIFFSSVLTLVDQALR